MKRLGQSGLMAFPILMLCFAVLLLISMSGSVKDVFLQVKVTRAMQDRAEIERWVRTGLNCPATITNLPAGVCPAGEIDLYRFESSQPVMVRKDPPFTQVGTFIVKARCENGPVKTIQLFVEKIGSGDVRMLRTSLPLTC